MENNTYIQILLQSQYQRQDILNKLLDLTKEQEEALKDPSLDSDVFVKIIDKKGKHISRLEKIDSGFAKLYEKVKDELANNKEKYEKEIKELQDTIKSITDLSMELQVKESNNKIKLQSYLETKRREIKNFNKSKSTASSYHKNINRQSDVPSYFFDRKK